jgi:uncharacterized protein YndB with AHSA1/START domain
MLKRILLVVVVLIGALLAYAATRPDTFRVERAAVIKAPPAKVFALIDDFHQWAGWSPWEKLDPSMKRSHSGAASGKGAVYAWEGNGDVGAGRMEILETTAPSRVLITSFIKPFEARNTAEYTLRPEGDPGHLGHVWARALRLQADAGVRQHGRDDRQGLRAGPGQPEGAGRTLSRPTETARTNPRAHRPDPCPICSDSTRSRHARSPLASRP